MSCPTAGATAKIKNTTNALVTGYLSEKMADIVRGREHPILVFRRDARQADQVSVICCQATIGHLDIVFEAEFRPRGERGGAPPRRPGLSTSN